MTSVFSKAGRLPAAFTTFVGRRREVGETRRLCGTARLLTLTGVGGVGKTRLALEVAAMFRKVFTDGVFVVDLAPVRDPSAVATIAATALGMPDLGARPGPDQLADYLAGRRAMLVLDNCEHLVEPCAELAQTLLSAAGELRILATSRETLGITGEHVLSLTPLPPDEALELLRDRITANQPGFRITDTNRAAANRLCADLDGLPLAIELAAARLRTLTLEQVADRLEDRFRLLTGGSRTALPRQRTLRGLVDWSYELCTPAERLLWSRLSVFAGGFGLDAAEAVCADEGIARHEVLDLLDRLIAQSVVLTTEREDAPRYRLLETIRQYGRQRLAESGKEQQLLLRHRDFYLTFAEQIANAWCGPGQAEALARLRAEHANLLMAMDCGDDPQITLALVSALRFHWCVGGFIGEGRRRLNRALADAPEPTAVRARALWVAAWVAELQGDSATAERWLTEAAQLGEQCDDPVACAYAQTFRGTMTAYLGQREEAVPLLQDAVAAHSALGEGVGTVFTLFQLALVQADLGDPRAAETGKYLLAAAEAHGDRWGGMFALWAQGYDTYMRGDLETALSRIRAALKIEEDFIDYFATVVLVGWLAWITADAGDYKRAAQLLGAAGALWQDLGSSYPVFSHQTKHHQARCEEIVVGALGLAAYQRAFAEGSAVSGPAQAIAFALGVSTAPAAPTITPILLTHREQDVAALVAKGMSNRRIAAELVLSTRTVDGHVGRILAKLGFDNRTELAAWWATNQVPST